MDGVVEEINITATEAAPCLPAERVRVRAGRGIQGDRHFSGERPHRDPGRALTLIAAEALEGLAADTGIALSAAASRRNVLTRGIDLNALVGRRFTVGELVCEGIELCEPCNHLQSLTRPGVLRGLVHRAGINAAVLADGEIAVGDPVRDVGPATGLG
jgi:MOSC domain-containing protein YiiM